MHPRRHRGQRGRPPRRPRPQGRSPVLTDTASPAPVGAYVHIPFCASRCDYCAFATWTDRAHLVDDYVDAVVAHVEQVVETGAWPPVSSVFFGGGTPSLIAAGQLTRILAAIPRAANAEVTVECNPDTITAALLDEYAQGGVTRLSMGVQSFVPHVLASLGRTHDETHVTRAVEWARASGLSFNLDLIYGAAGESTEDWEQTIDRAIELEPHHVSAYGLTVEAGTPLAADASRHPDDDDQADKYLIASERLEAAGYGWYEISNWAKPGHRCRHNLLYWAQGDYLAFGCAAHGHRAGRRWWNVRTPERYIEAVQAGRDPEGGHEVLDERDRAREANQLALRTMDGVALSALPDLEVLGDLVEVRNGRAHLTRHGRLLANEVAIRLT